MNIGWCCRLNHMCVLAKSLQLCLTFFYPMDCRLPGSSVHGILWARILEWVAMPSSRRPSLPRNWTHVSCFLHWQVGSLPIVPTGKPIRRKQSNSSMFIRCPKNTHCRHSFFFLCTDHIAQPMVIQHMNWIQSEVSAGKTSHKHIMYI